MRKDDKIKTESSEQYYKTCQARAAVQADIPALRNLWEQAFGEEDGFMDSFFQKRADLDNILLLSDKNSGKLLSMLFMLSCEIKTSNGDILPAVNIVGVATDINERHKGYMTRLINYCFGVLKSRCIYMAVLKPSNRSFYEQYGFKVCNILYESGIKGDLSHSSICYEITPGLIQRLDDIYMSSPCTGFRLLRTYDDWEFHLRDMTVVEADNSYSLCVNKNGNLVSLESVPVIRGRERGYTMYKVISESESDIDIGEENMIFEQY